MYKSWIHPTLEYGNILYSGAAQSHLQRLDNLQARIERTVQPKGNVALTRILYAHSSTTPHSIL